MNREERNASRRKNAPPEARRPRRRTAPSGRSLPAELGEYMTPDEFAELPSDVHHAVWRAHAERRIGAIPSSAAPSGCTLLYHRAQVLALTGETAAAR